MPLIDAFTDDQRHRLPLYNADTHLHKFLTIQIQYSVEITYAVVKAALGMSKFHNFMGAFRRKVVYHYED